VLAVCADCFCSHWLHLPRMLPLCLGCAIQQGCVPSMMGSVYLYRCVTRVLGTAGDCWTPLPCRTSLALSATFSLGSMMTAGRASAAALLDLPPPPVLAPQVDLGSGLGLLLSQPVSPQATRHKCWLPVSVAPALPWPLLPARGVLCTTTHCLASACTPPVAAPAVKGWPAHLHSPQALLRLSGTPPPIPVAQGPCRAGSV
jgi:hypothetical protein